MRANESDSRENFTRANGEATAKTTAKFGAGASKANGEAKANASDKATAKATANFGAGASRANGEAKATASAKASAKTTAAAQALYKAKYFVIALLLAVVAITSVGVSKWNIHIQQQYPNNFSYVNSETANTSGGAAGDPILTRYLKIDYTETAQNTKGATAQQKTAYYRDTLKAENPTTFTYNGGSFEVKVSDDEYGDLQTDENGNYLKDANGNYLQNNPDASPWSEWKKVGLGFTYAYKRTARINSIGQTVGCSEPLTDGALPTNAGVYQCVIKATTNDNYNTTQTSSKKAAVDAAITQLNYVTNPNDGTEQCAAVISFTIKQRDITVSVADKTSTYGDDHLAGNPLTATTDDAVANAENTANEALSPDLNKIVRLYTTKTENGTASEYELERTSPAGKYGIEGSALKQGATDLINDNYKVIFVYPGDTTQPQGQQPVAFNGEREAEANTLALYVGAGATAVAFASNSASNTAVSSANNTASNVAGKRQTQPVANGGVALLDGESPNGGTEPGNVNENGTYTITTRKITVTIDNQTSVYGDAIKDLTYKLKDGSLANEDKLENIIRVTTTATSTSNVGEYPITGSQYNENNQIINANYAVTFVGTGENGTKGVYTITKRPVTITWGETAFSYVYNGAEQKPNPTFDDLLSGHKATVTVAAQSGSSLTSGKSINKGNYTMTVALPSQNYKWKGTDNSDNKTQDFSITARPITVTIANKSSTYGEPIKQLTATTTDAVAIADDKKANNGNLSGNLNALITLSAKDASGKAITNKSNVDTYAITGSQKTGFPAQNYDIIFQNGTYEITKRQVTLDWFNLTLIYNGKAQKPTATADNLVPGDSVTVTGEQINAGQNYTATATISDNYNITNPTTQFTINKLAITVKANDQSATYTGAEPTAVNDYAITLTNGGTLPSFVNSELSVTVTKQAGFDAGTYTLTPNVSAKEGYSLNNYTVTTIGGTFTINKATVDVPSPATQTFTYNGTEQTYNIAENVNYTITGNKQKDAGSYTATVSLNDKVNYRWNNSSANDTADKTYNFTVNKATLTVKAENASVNMGQPANFTYTMTGFVNGETETGLRNANALTGNVTFTCGYNKDETNPDNVNDTYDITPVVSNLSATNYTFTPDPAPGTLTVNKNTGITKPTADTTVFTYNGSAQTYTPVNFDTATMNITGNVKTDAGTYTVTVTPKPNYVWSDFVNNNTEEVTFTFKINPKPVTITWGNTTFTYNGSAQAPSATYKDVNNADQNATLSIKDITTTSTNGQAINAGNYEATATAGNNYAIDNPTISFKINKLEVYLSNDLIEKSYGETATLSKSVVSSYFDTTDTTLTSDIITSLVNHHFKINITAKNYLTDETANDSLGLLAYTVNDGSTVNITKGSTYLLTLSVTNNNHNNMTYRSDLNGKLYYKYKTAKVGETYYTIEDALTKGGNITLASNSTGEKTYVITAFSKLGLSGSSADDPFVAYKADYNYTNSSKIILPYDSGKNSSSITEEAPKGVTTYVGSVLVLQAGITLNVSGFIDVTACIIHTGVTRARGVIMNHGTINVTTGGTITSYGYIKGTGTIDLADGAIMTDIFKIYDWMGGRNSLGIVENAKDVFPISAYSLHNTSCHVKINYGARYKAKFYACTSAANFDETLTIVGINETNTMFKLSSGYIDKSAGESLTNPGTALSTITGSNQIKGQRDNIQINGVCTDGTVSISKSGYVIDSSPLRPIPIGYMSVVVNEGTLNLHNVSYKFLPGSSLTISTNGTLSVGSNITTWFYSLEQCIIDDKVTYTNNNNPSVYNYAFATETGGNVVDRQDAYLQVDGIATFATGSSIAGLIKTQSDSATLTINGKTQATINILKSIAYNSSSWGGSNVTTDTSTNTATADILISATTSDVRSLAPGVYYSKNLNDNYVWYANKATLTYNTNGGSSIQSQERTISQTGYVITSTDVSYIPTKDNYTFVNWYMDNNWQTLAEGQTIFTSCNLYAKWEPVKYTITYNILYDDGVSSSGTVINDNPTEYTIESNFYLVSPIDGDLKFINWCKDQSCTIKITQIVSMSGDLTIYGKFYNSNLSVYTVDYVTNNSDYTIAQQSILSSNASSFVPEDLSSRNTDKDYMYRFEGWYTTPTFDTGTEFVTLTDSCTLYAKWSEKIEIMLSIDGSEYAGTQKYVNPGDSGTIPGIEALNIDGHRTITQAIEGCTLDGNQYTVSSGATTVKIKIDRKKLYDVQLIITNATVTINGKSYNSNGTIEKIAIEGEIITFSISFSSGYINQKWSIKGITPVQEGNSAISNRTFTMPAQKVTIEASSAEESSGGCSIIKETNNTPPAVMPIFTTFVATLLGGYILVSKKKRKNNKAI